jgi:hypothetical protein
MNTSSLYHVYHDKNHDLSIVHGAYKPTILTGFMDVYGIMLYHVISCYIYHKPS